MTPQVVITNDCRRNSMTLLYNFLLSMIQIYPFWLSVNRSTIHMWLLRSQVCKNFYTFFIFRWITLQNSLRLNANSISYIWIFFLNNFMSNVVISLSQFPFPFICFLLQNQMLFAIYKLLIVANWYSWWGWVYYKYI